MSLAPDECQCVEYCSYLGLETKATNNSRKGRKPQVDYTMTGFVEGDALYVIPVENNLRKEHCADYAVHGYLVQRKVRPQVVYCRPVARPVQCKTLLFSRGSREWK